MAKKKNWLDQLKKLFTSEALTKQEKKERRRRWLFGKLKSKLSPALTAPSLQRLRSEREAELERKKHAVAVAVAVATAAAAVTAAEAAVLVVCLAKNPLSYHQTEDAAAIKIQTIFRGYLARRALGALKGLVKLQALIRGQAVRRQTNITLKCLQSLMKIQSHDRAKGMRVAANLQSHEVEGVLYVKIMENNESGHSQTEIYNGSRSDSSILSKEEIIALLRKRQEAEFKRERAVEYASTLQERRHSRRPITQVDHDLDTNTLDPKWSRVDRWIDAQHLVRDIGEILQPSCQFHYSDSLSNLCSAHEGKPEDLEVRNLARRSFNWSRRALLKDDDALSSSPYFPSYMASTASTKAKFRSVSTPKQRPGTLDYSYHCSLSRDSLSSPLPSLMTSEHHLKSPRLRGSAGTAKHYRPSTYFSGDSEHSLLSWGMLSPLR